jgi:hypothetical protein
MNLINDIRDAACWAKSMLYGSLLVEAGRRGSIWFGVKKIIFFFLVHLLFVLALLFQYWGDCCSKSVQKGTLR